MIDPAQVVSPEQLAQLKAMIEAAGAHESAQAGWVDALGAIGKFIGDAGWPLVALVALLLFRGPISRIRTFSYKEVKLEIDRQIERAGERAAEGASGTRQGVPTTEEVAQSGEVEKLAETADPGEIRRTALRLAAEYERVRAGMAPGDARTRRMEVVVSKMRSIGRAVIPLRHELMASPSPGQRLMAIASLQVSPDYELLGWLVSRLSVEKPFVGYHAAVGLLVAARDPRAGSNLRELVAAKAQLAVVEGQLRPDTDRAVTLTEFKSLVERLNG